MIILDKILRQLRKKTINTIELNEKTGFYSIKTQPDPEVELWIEWLYEQLGEKETLEQLVKNHSEKIRIPFTDFMDKIKNEPN